MSKAADALRAIAGGVDLGKATATPSIPNVPKTDDPRLNQFMSAVKQIIETREGERGNSLDSAVTWRELIEKQFASVNGDQNSDNIFPSWLNVGSNSGNQPVMTIPPEPTGFEGDGAFANIILSWDDPPYINHGYTEVWRSGENNLGTAQLIGMAAGSVYVDYVGGSASYYYWIKFVSMAGVKGPFNGIEGLLAQTSPDPGFLLEVLTGQLQESQLNNELSSRIDLIDAPATNPDSVAGRILAETNARVTAINTEAATRAQAILDEAAARQGADSNLQTQINLLSAASSGDFSELLAAVQEEQTARIAGDAAEATARQTLATQMRGTYTGTDVTQVTTGLIHSERQARSSADSALSTSISSLQTTVTNNYNTLNSAITTEASTRATADTANATNISAVTARLENIKDKQGVATGKTIEATLVDNKTAQVDGDSALATSISNLSSTVTNNYNTLNSSITTEATTRSNADNALSLSITNLSSTVTGNYNTLNAAIQSEASTRASADNAISEQVNTVFAAATKARTYRQTSAPTTGMLEGDLWFDTDDNNKAYRYSGTAWVATDDARLASNAAAIQTEATARADGDSANAALINQVQARLDTGDYAAVKTESSTTASAVDGIQAKYSVKTDVNGYVSGFGLISTANNATPFSQFIFKADQFAFGAPGLTSVYPFVIQATATTVNGVAVPAGAYIDAAYIKNGSITSAKIGNAAIDNAKIANLDAGKITTGYLSADRINANSVTADKIDSRGLSIKDMAGNVILAAGTSLSTSYISGLGTLATANSVSTSQVTGLGSFATLNQITTANVSTYIASAAIQNAQIGAAAISTAKIGDAAVNTLKIGANAVTVPVRYSFGAAVGTGSTFTGSFTLPDAASVVVHISMTLPNDNGIYRNDANDGWVAGAANAPIRYPDSIGTKIKLTLDGTIVYNEVPNNSFGSVVSVTASKLITSSGSKSFSLEVMPYNLPNFVNAGLIPRNIVVYVLGAAR